MRYVLTSIDPSSPRTSPTWTGYLDIPSKLERPVSTMSITLPSRSRDKENEPGAKLSKKGGSFLKFISLVQILVFVDHVILSAKRGLKVTVGEDGPSDVFLEVSVTFEMMIVSLFLEPSSI